MFNSSLFKRIELQLLMNLTAHALGKKPKRIWTLSNSEALKVYAEFTSSTLQTDAGNTLFERLNTEAYKMGRLLRRLFWINNEFRAQRLIVSLYHNIGIQLSFSSPQQLCFHRCYFSSFYTTQICKVASALDSGIICGIAGLPSKHLQFCQRITEGCHCCRAQLTSNNYEESYRNR